MNIEVVQSSTDNLVAGTFPQITGGVTLKQGKIYKRGEILEFDVDGKAVSLATESKAKVILAKDIDATDADIDAMVFKTGQFHLDECVFNDTLDKEAIIEALHVRSVFLKVKG